jgi:CRISPR-associated protein Csd1
MAPFGFEAHPYRWAIVLDEAGRVAALEDERIEGKGVPLMVPAWAGNRTSKIIPSFLTDPAQYVLGLDEDRTKAWIEHNLTLLTQATDARLVAIRKWLKRWTVEAGAALAERHEVKWGQPVAIKIGDIYAHEVPEARQLWERNLAKTPNDEGLCVVTGKIGRLVSTHGTLPLAESGKLVSFDLDSTALRHWGYEGNDNAPVSE